MAVNKVIQTSSLVLEIENGKDKTGKTVYKKKSFSNVKPDAKSADIMDVALAFKGILSVGVRNILVSDTSMLVKEAE